MNKIISKKVHLKYHWFLFKKPGFFQMTSHIHPSQNPNTQKEYRLGTVISILSWLSIRLHNSKGSSLSEYNDTYRLLFAVIFRLWNLAQIILHFEIFELAKSSLYRHSCNRQPCYTDGCFFSELKNRFFSVTTTMRCT